MPKKTFIFILLSVITLTYLNNRFKEILDINKGSTDWCKSLVLNESLISHKKLLDKFEFELRSSGDLRVYFFTSEWDGSLPIILVTESDGRLMAKNCRSVWEPLDFKIPDIVNK
jgi:hypothetical protein